MPPAPFQRLLLAASLLSAKATLCCLARPHLTQRFPHVAVTCCHAHHRAFAAAARRGSVGPLKPKSLAASQFRTWHTQWRANLLSDPARQQSHKHADCSVWAALLSKSPMKADGVSGRPPCKTHQTHSTLASRNGRSARLFTHSCSFDRKPQIILWQLQAGKVLDPAVETCPCASTKQQKVGKRMPPHVWRMVVY